MRAAQDHRSVIGIVARNSTEFVRHMLAILEGQKTALVIEGRDDHARLQAFRPEEVLDPEQKFGWLELEHQPSRSEDIAQIVFTSGTEGQPKAVELSHRALADVVARLHQVMGLDSSVREYLGVPAYHSFGFGRCRAVLAAKGRIYIPENGFDPLEVASMLAAGEINAVSAVPSLWRVVLDGSDLFAPIGGKLKWIEIGSQYMSREEKVRLRELFPNAVIVQHYGLTEASRSTFLRIDQSEGDALESVGAPIGEVEVQLSEEGRIMVRGPHVASRVWVDGVATVPVDADGWYTTNDRGLLRDGNVFFEGRVDDVINCGGLKLSPDRLEAGVRERIPGAPAFAVCRIPDRMRGDGILLVVEAPAERLDELARTLLDVAAQSGVSAQGALRVAVAANLTRTATGKVRRSELANQHQDAPYFGAEVRQVQHPTEGTAGPQNERERELVKIWRQALGVEDIGVEESFYDLGGDSVTALGVVVRMSRAGIDVQTCRRIFQGASIREIAATQDLGTSGAVPKAEAHSEYLNTLVVNAVRGILTAAVIMGHWSEGAIDRLPSSFAWLGAVLAPFFSFGTPGFAIVFGLGFGYLYLERLNENSARVWTAMRLGTTIVGAGVVLMAILGMANASEAVTRESFFAYFYGPLMFYFLALPTMPLWGKLAHLFPTDWRFAGILALAVVALGLSEVWHQLLWEAEADGFLRLVRLMLVAKYNYFKMMWGVLLGLALGGYVRRYASESTIARKVMLIGVGLVGCALTYGAVVGELGILIRWPSPLTVWKWIFYYGCVSLLVGSLLALRSGYSSRSQVLRKSIEGVATVGQLALPFFVLHEAIIPLKGALTRFGVPSDALALLLVLTLFFGVSWLMVRRVSMLFHSS